MNVPSFPPHDLAKLVLGYLAEEQLMTAYDEFLQASPYLDALVNEYDRMFMTSLKNILAEYRAVKIFVETCKPLALRRRLFGCTNLLEVVKFLVSHIDYSKICAKEVATDICKGVAIDPKLTDCLDSNCKLTSCICKMNISGGLAVGIVKVPKSSVETTSLEDLPGNYGTSRKKNVRTLDKDSKVSKSSCSYTQNMECSNISTHNMSVSECNMTTSRSLPVFSTPYNHLPIKPIETTGAMYSVKRAEEFNDVLNIVGKDSSAIGNNHKNSIAGTITNTPGLNGSESRNIVPDSSTSEISNQTPSTKESCDIGSLTPNNIGRNQQKTHILLKVGSLRNNVLSQTNNEVIRLEPVAKPHFQHLGAIKPKQVDQKVTILSDVKVDKPVNNYANLPAVLKNATSTPVVQMQTILINGTPAFRTDSRKENYTYTKDEIMAMPTIILVPNSGSSNVPASILTETKNVSPIDASTTCSSSQPLGPLVIDVLPDKSQEKLNTEHFVAPQNITHTNEPDLLVKAMDVKNASMPKDMMTVNKSTPKMMPPERKSSSTPRRTSHIRVLDFATPRRLEETMNEHEELSDEVIMSSSPNLHKFVEKASSDNVVSEDKVVAKNADVSVDYFSTKSKRSNWDTDLRALAVENGDKQAMMKRKPKSKQAKKKRLSIEKKALQADLAEKHKLRKTPKNKAKSLEIIEEPSVVDVDKTVLPIKPTINIIVGTDRDHSKQDEKNQNKSNNDDPDDTPEAERLTLQNTLGAKLNISDLLETPYKQALYDIQMETPRFLGPDLPGEPFSDIKIMNIPTPLFLTTPKPVAATPSSYSSRPTDYSSGGSYYKPDDHDYVPVEDFEYPVPTLKGFEAQTDLEIPVVSDKDDKEKAISSKCRPVRQCTKNVSYAYASPKVHKKEVNKFEATSSCSETTSVYSLVDSKIEMNKVTKAPKEKKGKRQSRPEKKRSSFPKKHKTPVKKESPRTFMKIKPRRTTPQKVILSGHKSKSSEISARKRTTSKEKIISAVSLAVSAPTKSRRKSSTPRKLHCTKTFNSETPGHDSSDITNKIKQTVNQDAGQLCVQDSDTEQMHLRWSDDGSQDVKSKEIQTNNSVNDSEDISKIRQYIETSEPNRGEIEVSGSSLHEDLVRRGFDKETAKNIERDLLDSPPQPEENIIVNITPENIESKNKEMPLEKSAEVSAQSSSANLQIVEDEEEIEDIELSVSECHEQSLNYIVCQHDVTKEDTKTSPVKLKDKFCMEICIDDGMPIRLRATSVTALFDEDLEEVNHKETEIAVNSISNFERLYTPMKDAARAQCFEIFDSTLTSLDTPIKPRSPKKVEYETTVTEIVLEVEKVDDHEKIEVKEKAEVNKRKRLLSVEVSEESTSESKRPKSDAQYLLNSANIQDIDIETVLSKLHGP